MRYLWCVLLVFLIAGRLVNANDKDPNDPNDPNESAAIKAEPAANDPNDPNDPNELLWTKWEVVIKDPNDPNELLRANWDAIISVLQNKDLDQKTKEKIVGKIVVPFFDFPLIAKLALGRKHWPKFTQPQREKFTRLFAERLKASYLDKISLYTDEKAFIKPILRKGNAISIPMELISKDTKIAIIYKIRKVDKSWKIYDIEIQGVSVVLTYRSQFDDILQRDTVEELLSRLQKQINRRTEPEL